MAKLAYFVCSTTLPLGSRLKNESFGPQTSQYENVGNLDEGQNDHSSLKSNVTGQRLFFDQKYMVFLAKWLISMVGIRFWG